MIWVIIILIIICLVLVIRLKAIQTNLSNLRKSDKLKAAFIKAMARELRTPLHSVSGLAEIISKEDLYGRCGIQKIAFNTIYQLT